MKPQYICYNPVLFILAEDSQEAKDRLFHLLEPNLLRHPSPLFEHPAWCKAGDVLPTEIHGPITYYHHDSVKPMYAIGALNRESKSVTFPKQDGLKEPLTVNTFSLASRFLAYGMSVYYIENDNITTLTGRWFDNTKHSVCTEFKTLSLEDFARSSMLEFYKQALEQDNDWWFKNFEAAEEWFKANEVEDLFNREPLECPLPQHLELVGVDGSPKDGKLRIPLEYHPCNTMASSLLRLGDYVMQWFEETSKINREVIWTMNVYATDDGEPAGCLNGSYGAINISTMRYIFRRYDQEVVYA